ncbi:NAD(+) synthase [Flammeovirga yaeyamensis]|uniref:Glutamine-dependent NAD(+) synthetase n=1 Tax=Flammeovirga yaeyamensis TaxID=367791 RepID=A0AAX1MY05_9BACT|nr:NAD(+) synthase [Flammeovirga yaeyamensis]MBB3696285.1 NAD+ synthase (glutamine-hydrolyzing) [Flammeovirga yaeyamensis]NMF34966.1 NAD(+) synthase [Flammeovirga yaeyamensis]QWG00209.1 NAD(+) synthase [Flammeovirga yaeyamensis]
MTNLIKVAGAELNQTPLDWNNNFENIKNAIETAKEQNVSILCLPELSITGYGCEDAFYAPNTEHQALKILGKILPLTKDLVISVGLPLRFKNKLYNTVVLIVNQKIKGFVAKKHLAGNGIHYEPRWFTPWIEGEFSTIEFDDSYASILGDTSFPFGDLIFNVNGVKIGFEICEDAWVANRPGRTLYHQGVDIILNPSASHFAFDKLDVRKRFVLEGSRAFGVGYIYANLLGNESGRAIYDGGVMIALSGKLLSISKRFAFYNYKVTTATFDLDIARLAQIQSHTSNTGTGNHLVVKDEFKIPRTTPEKHIPVEESWEHSDNIKEEEFGRAVALGLFDYMRKSFSKGYVVSLSGGADSSSIVTLIHLMIKMGIEDLGLEGFKSKLSYFSALSDCEDDKALCEKILTTAYQPTENSGDVTLNAATELAKAVGATFYTIDVNPMYKGYLNAIENAIERKLGWDTDDITLQNIQARVRAPSVWMLANINGALLLSTSNRSEAAVGYATMDGDTSGGLSPIAGIDKNYLRSWLRWMETNGLDNKWNVPELKLVNDQQPTAELRPKDSKQTDEADLMPYDILEEIEKLAIRDKKSPQECQLFLSANHPDASRETIIAWVKKFFQLWSRNQWKRERYAPSFHLDDKNLDPKTWCRFPILSGGFRNELSEL